MTAAIGFAIRSKAVAKRFLQSVVVVDDQVSFELPASDNLEAGARPSDNAETQAALNLDNLELTPPASGPPPADEQELNVKQLVDAFAKEGLVCGILKPSAGEDLELLALKAARRADILILDWHLANDYGERTRAFIRALLEDDQVDEGRRRLIVVFTAEGDLKAVTDSVATVVEDFYITSPLKRLNDFTLQKGPLRIAMFAKPRARIAEQDPEVMLRRITEADLPTRVIAEFAESSAGLVANVALDSVAELRANTHHLLTRLGPELDPAYLWHRAVQAHPTEAQEHLVAIVVDELRSILEDAEVGKEADLAACEAWLAKAGTEVNYAERFNMTGEPRTLEQVAQLLRDGASGNSSKNKAVQELFPRMKPSRSPQRAVMAAFAATAEQNMEGNAAFGRLMSLKAHYGAPVPHLTLGAILLSQEDGKACYWLCVQPRCDAVRLEGAHPFPLLPFKVHRHTSPDRKAHVVLEGGPGEDLYLELETKPNQIRMAVFSVNDTERELVTASAQEEDGPKVWFRDTQGRDYQWCADFKSEHAQWMINELVREFGRIGLIESEWLRLLYTK